MFIQFFVGMKTDLFGSPHETPTLPESRDRANDAAHSPTGAKRAVFTVETGGGNHNPNGHVVHRFKPSDGTEQRSAASETRGGNHDPNGHVVHRFKPSDGTERRSAASETNGGNLDRTITVTVLDAY